MKTLQAFKPLVIDTNCGINMQPIYLLESESGESIGRTSSKPYADLFRTAPEMLEALKLSLKLLEFMQKKDIVGYSTIESVIAKAEGKA